MTLNRTSRMIGGLALALLACSVAAIAQEHPSSCQGDFVVHKVVLENSVGLSTQQRAEIERAVIGQCFQQGSTDTIGMPILQRLVKLGYPHSFVEDPIVRVLDSNRRPSPVRLVFYIGLSPERATK